MSCEKNRQCAGSRTGDNTSPRPGAVCPVPGAHLKATAVLLRPPFSRSQGCLQEGKGLLRGDKPPGWCASFTGEEAIHRALRTSGSLLLPQMGARAANPGGSKILSPWQHQHALLVTPGTVWRLLRNGAQRGRPACHSRERGCSILGSGHLLYSEASVHLSP